MSIKKGLKLDLCQYSRHIFSNNFYAVIIFIVNKIEIYRQRYYNKDVMIKNKVLS